MEKNINENLIKGVGIKENDCPQKRGQSKFVGKDGSSVEQVLQLFGEKDSPEAMDNTGNDAEERDRHDQTGNHEQCHRPVDHDRVLALDRNQLCFVHRNDLVDRPRDCEYQAWPCRHCATSCLEHFPDFAYPLGHWLFPPCSKSCKLYHVNIYFYNINKGLCDVHILRLINLLKNRSIW